MSVCLNCGKEYDGCLCDECRNTADIEALCRKIIEYSVGSGDNPLWDRIAAELSSTGNFRNAVNFRHQGRNTGKSCHFQE